MDIWGCDISVAALAGELSCLSCDKSCTRYNSVATALHIASVACNIELVRILLKHGLDVAGIDEDGKTPLHYASESGHVEVGRLLEHGADVTAQGRRSASAKNNVTYRCLAEYLSGLPPPASHPQVKSAQARAS